MQRWSVILWLIIFFAVFGWSAIAPKDRFTWVLEVAPAVVGFVLIVLTWKSFPLTVLLYWLILLHAVVLMIGGHYTYAEVPLFDTIKPWFGFERNNYDKLGHFLQGLVPAILAREILIRKNVVSGRAWTNFIVVSVCLAFSAFYELIEWTAALISSEAADAFLGTQGYIWDTQADMAFALLGAIVALIVLSATHDRQLSGIK
jgi:putative membrane protein